MLDLPAPPGINPGPRTLRLLPLDQQQALDPYMQLIVGYRKSGLSLNHIIGCPLDCGYCVRHFWGNFDDKTPQLLVSTNEAIELLVNHAAFQPHVTPVQLFNKATDPFLPGVKPHLFQVLRALDERGYTNHILIITRFTVTATDMAVLESLKHLKVTLLFTYSGITDSRVEPIVKSDITVRSIKTAAAHRGRTKVILYWRPIVPGWNDDPDTMAGVLEIGRDVDSIVFTGYYHKEENAAFLRGLGVQVPYGDDFARRKVMPGELDAKVIAAWRASGVATPLYRKTSCGVSAAHQVADYNGHWGVQELCDICPNAQRQLCADAHRTPTGQDIDDIMQRLGFDSRHLIVDGHVWTTLPEQQRYAIQHALGFQTWTLDNPHFKGNHGRSLHGYDLTDVDRAELERVRQILLAESMQDDD